MPDLLSAPFYLSHARGTLGWDEVTITRRYLNIIAGRYYNVAGAIQTHQAKQDSSIKTDAELADSAARFATRYTTKATIKYAQSLGGTIMARETYNPRTKRRQDVAHWDVVFVLDGVNCVAQGWGPGESLAHFRKIEEGNGMIFADRINARKRFGWQFERGNPTPVRSWVYDDLSGEWVEEER